MKKRIITEKYREAHRKRQIRFMQDPEYRENTLKNLGNTGRTHFKKGQRPWNYIDGRSKGQNWNRYGSDWKNIRKQVLIRDNNQCQMCGKFEGRLEIHHKIPFLISKDNSLKNLITLCPKCHRFVENQTLKRIKKINVEMQEVVKFGR